MTTIAEQMSSWTVGLHYSQLPADVAHLAKRMIIDTIGCALGGYTANPVRLPATWPAWSAVHSPAP